MRMPALFATADQFCCTAVVKAENSCGVDVLFSLVDLKTDTGVAEVVRRPSVKTRLAAARHGACGSQFIGHVSSVSSACFRGIYSCKAPLAKSFATSSFDLVSIIRLNF
jgi:hypothetical protein